MHVGPSFSTTAASADEWVWVRPGFEGLLALSLAQVIVAEGLASGPGVAALGEAPTLAPYSPERVADQTGLPAVRLRDLARRFAAERPSLALAGGSAAAHTNGTVNVAADLALNRLVGTVGTPGGVLIDASPPGPDIGSPAESSPLSAWQDLAERLRAGRIGLVLVHGANPVFGLPELDGRRGGPVRDRLSWLSFKQLVRDAALGLASPTQPGAPEAAEHERQWSEILRRGGVWGEAAAAPALPEAAAGSAAGLWEPPAIDGDADAHPFRLLPFAHNTLGDGRAAHLLSLQAAPDPVITVTWRSWVEVHPGVAARYGLREGDVVRVETAHGQIELPINVSPAAPPDVLAIPLGWGHTALGH